MRFKEVKKLISEDQDLFEVNMSPSNLSRLAGDIDARAGMEFEMYVPNIAGGGDDYYESEPDYDQDQRCRSIQDAYEFFYDREYNSRADADRLRDKMTEDYYEWVEEKINKEWESDGEDYILEWVKNNVDESEWNPDDLDGDDRNEALEEYTSNVHADPGSTAYQEAYEEFREDHREDWDESDWLEDADLDSMRDIEGNYSITWPYYTEPSDEGEADIEEVADQFSAAIGRPARAYSNYHQSGQKRPGTGTDFYVVEPDGSLDAEDSSADKGLEFVSPALSIPDMLSDLDKVAKWAASNGCYTNESTGLHINVSVPGFELNKLDYVKLAVLMGDKYVLEQFGRMGNSFAKSALTDIEKRIRSQPDAAEKLLDALKNGLEGIASKVIHSGITSKYTSINTKDKYIEFRSPGGDWLGDYAADPNKIKNTLLRFVVALDAACDPEKYKKEYHTKLYKLLTQKDTDETNTVKYFVDYVAGKIPQAALRSFVKQAQLQRKIKRGGTGDQKMWWKVYKDGRGAGRYSATVEVVASSEEEAKQKAAKEWGEPLLVNTLARMDAEAVRSYEDNANLSNSLRPSGPGPWEIYNRATGNSVMNIAQNQQPITDRGSAQAYAARLIADGRHDMYGVRTVGSEGYLVYDDSGRRLDYYDTQGEAIEAAQQLANRQGGPIHVGIGGRRIDTRTPQAVDARVDYELYNRTTGQVIDTFPARNDDEARIRLDDYRQHGAGQSDPENFGVRRGPAVTNQSRATTANQPVHRQYRILNQNQETSAGFLATSDQAALQQFQEYQDSHPNRQYSLVDDDGRPVAPAATDNVYGATGQARTDGRTINYGTQFNGEWKVLVNGDEVYRFSGVGNNQADANRVAAAWLRDNGMGVSGEGFEVYPVMR
jgi:hypothetical protein